MFGSKFKSVIFGVNSIEKSVKFPLSQVFTYLYKFKCLPISTVSAPTLTTQVPIVNIHNIQVIRYAVTEANQINVPDHMALHQLQDPAAAALNGLANQAAQLLLLRAGQVGEALEEGLLLVAGVPVGRRTEFVK